MRCCAVPWLVIGWMPLGRRRRKPTWEAGCSRGRPSYSQMRGAMRLLQIRVRTNGEAECLVRELAVYSPKRMRLALLVELDDRSNTEVLAILAAVETCLSANDIRSVRIELDGHAYTMEQPQLSR